MWQTALTTHKNIIYANEIFQLLHFSTNISNKESCPDLLGLRGYAGEGPEHVWQKGKIKTVEKQCIKINFDHFWRALSLSLYFAINTK
jgi:hypothetical protein